MPRIQPVEPENTTGQARELLDAAKMKMGRIPNILRTMAHSPAVLKSYLEFSGAMAGGSLPATLREQIALTVAEANGCAYCLAAHSALGKMAGLDADAIARGRQGEAQDARSNAALKFARQVLERKGFVRDEDLETVRAAGWGDTEVAEIVALVALNVFTNYFNHVTDPEIDFPPATPSAQSRAVVAAGA